MATIGAEIASADVIPEAELTPRVRAVIGALTDELQRLQLRFDEVKSDLDHALLAADRDMLLPVLNRRALIREISRFIDFADRYGARASLLFIDVDGFKAVNDMHGHAAGDAVLMQLCELLSANVRSSDIIGRLGGDEFAFILPGMSQSQSVEKGRMLLRRLEERPPVWRGEPVALRFSCGVCELRGGLDAASALAEADRAMYASKPCAKR